MPDSAVRSFSAAARSTCARRERRHRNVPATAARRAIPSTEPTTAHTQVGVPPSLLLLLPLLPLPLVLPSEPLLLPLLVWFSELKHSDVTLFRM